jgi:lysozyme
MILDSLRSSIRALQGERRGMGSELKPPTPREEAILEPEAIFAPTIAIQTSVRLADVSFWQGLINFVVMKAAGLFGVIIRAGQRNWADIKFKTNWALAKLAGLPRGSYFFYDSREDPRKQAELWWSLLEGDTGELAHAADFEESYGGSYGRKEDFKAFLLRFQELSGLPNDRIIIYTGFFWWLARVGDDPFFRRYQLWLASYGAMSQARIPAPWSAGDLLFWQYTSSGNGVAYGVSSQEIDLNWYCCDPFEYLRRFPLATMELPPIPPPPTQGEPMEGKILRFTNMRGDKTQNSADLGDLYAGDIVAFAVQEPGSDGLTWCLLTNATRNGTPVKRVDGKTIAQAPVWAWVDNIEVSPPPPEPTEEIVITQTLSSPGYASVTVTTTLKPE